MTDSFKNGISRRAFLTGAAAAGAVAAAGLAGCSTNTNETPSASAGADSTAGTGNISTEDYSWLSAPEEINDFADTIETEILIIGAGLSGLCTACSAAEEGADVLVVEKDSHFNGRGGGFGAINSRYMEEVGATFDKADAYGHWVAQTGSRSYEPLIAKFFRDSERASNWMLDKCEEAGAFIMVGDFFSKDTVWREVPGYHMCMLLDEDPFDYNPFLPATVAYEDSLKAGVEYLFNAPAQQLIKEDGKVVGAIVETEEGVYTRINASKGVVLATGDIAGDPEMVEAYAPVALPYPLERIQYTPIAVGEGWNKGEKINNGQGQKMAMWAGGKLVDTPGPTMMHPQAFTWFHGAFLFVNILGERFFCEDTWVQGKSMNMVSQPEQRAFSIFDSNYTEDIKNTVSYGGGMFWDSFRAFDTDTSVAADYFEEQMDMYLENGAEEGAATDVTAFRQCAWKADTIEELAELIKVPADTLKETVDRYNTMCEAGADIDFFKEDTFLTPIKEPPFYATKVGPAILAVPVGMECNEDFQCLDDEKEPIEGLYCTGNMVGNVIAVDYPINVAGNAHGRCITYGYDLGKQLTGVYEPGLKPGDAIPGLKVGEKNYYTAEGF